MFEWLLQLWGVHKNHLHCSHFIVVVFCWSHLVCSLWAEQLSQSRLELINIMVTDIPAWMYFLSAVLQPPAAFQLVSVWSIFPQVNTGCVVYLSKDNLPVATPFTSLSTIYYLPMTTWGWGRPSEGCCPFLTPHRMLIDSVLCR